MSDNRTDEEFLDYVDTHSHSQDGALFSGEHLIRLRDLSGMFLTAMGGIDPGKLYPLRVVDAMPLVRRAREKLKAVAQIERLGLAWSREVEAWFVRCESAVSDLSKDGNTDVAHGICEAVQWFCEQHNQDPPAWTQI